jgi:hypothetical protein
LTIFGLEIDKDVETLSSERIIDDLSLFIQSCCENLYVIRVNNAEEFNIVARSLPKFTKDHKDVKLIVIDGLHYFGHRELSI